LELCGYPDIRIIACRVEIEGKWYLHAVIRDVTRRKQMAESLHRSEARYNDLVRSIPVGVFALRACPEGPKCFDYVSPRLCEMLGIDRDEMLRDVNRGFVMAHPDDRERLLGETMDAIRRLTPFRWVGRFVINGETRWISIKSDPTLLPDGDSIWNGVVSDITERKTTEEALLASKTRFASIFRNCPVGIGISRCSDHRLRRPLQSPQRWSGELHGISWSWMKRSGS
jgi:PAS domain S-box-containing protein